MSKVDYDPFMHGRYLESPVGAALARKMVFIGGPRQVGKTTFALGFLGREADERHPAYLNWDHPAVRPRLRRAELPDGEPMLLLDEIHKYARWRNLLKGIHDTEKSTRRIIVTGSARLDYYRKGGDSLAGRYRYFRLHPFSLRELNRSPSRSDLDVLMRRGGFPEPLFSLDDAGHRIWQRDRLARVVREDLRDLEHVREISLVEHLVDLPYTFFAQRSAGDLMMRVNSNAVVREMLTSSALSGLLDGLFVSFYLLLLFTTNAALGLLVLGLGLLQIIVFAFSQRQLFACLSRGGGRLSAAGVFARTLARRCQWTAYSDDVTRAANTARRPESDAK